MHSSLSQRGVAKGPSRVLESVESVDHRLHCTAATLPMMQSLCWSVTCSVALKT